MKKLMLLFVLLAMSCSVDDDKDNSDVNNETGLSSYKVVYIHSGNLDKGSPVLNMIPDKTKMKNVLTSEVVENVLLDSDLDRTQYTFETIEKTSKMQIVYANEIDISTNPDEVNEISIIIQVYKNDELISEKNADISSSNNTYSLNETF